MKKVAILQSNYIPWKGYFDLINSVSDFVIYDDMQYTRRDWRNRNKIYTPQGIKWLTIPVDVKGKYFQKINQTQISDKNWGYDHWKTLQQFYSKALFFKDYTEVFEELYLNNNETYLSKININFIKEINKILNIKTQIHQSSNFDLTGDRTDRLVNICQSLGANIYLTGPAAKDYLDESLFDKNGINVEWMDYSAYPEYQQLHTPFEHHVTILDLIFNEGKNSTQFMKSFKHDSI